MNLDNLDAIQQLDKSRMIDDINGLPDQLLIALKAVAEYSLPEWIGFENLLIAGMGGSAIAGDLLSAYLAPTCPLPIFVHRDYGVPAWVSATKTLVICCSHSGNTEETLSSFEAAKALGCRVAVITTGGKLAAAAKAAGYPVWLFQHSSQPRSAVGFGFVYLINMLARLKLVPDPSQDIRNTSTIMKAEQEKYLPESPVVRNPAKRQAGQMVDRNVVLIGAGLLAPVGRRWKGQINELAKAAANFDTLPEADHNSLAGTLFPMDQLDRTITIFLRCPADQPANRRRADLTKKAYMLAGIATDNYTAPAGSAMGQQWAAIHYGDYVAYYLAMSYQVDPTPVDPIQNFKKELQA